MKRLLLFLLRLYKKLVSPLLPKSCRFEPTCSEYAAKAVERFGVLRGTYLAAGRLLRCQPFCRGGYDPVPETFSFRRGKGLSKNGGNG